MKRLTTATGAEVAQPFRYYLRVRYHECDAQRVVFNGRYGEYVDIAAVEFLRAALPRPSDVFDGTFEVQTVRQTLEWKAPARLDDVLEMAVRVRHIGTTSLTISTELRRAGESATLAAAETTYVHVDAALDRKREISPEVRAALEAGAAGQVVDHAAYRGLRERRVGVDSGHVSTDSSERSPSERGAPLDSTTCRDVP